MIPLKLIAVQKPMRRRYRISPVEMSGQNTLACRQFLMLSFN